MQKRTYGNKPEQLSIIGFGGIVVTNEEQSAANNYVAEAIDKGVNYFDVAPSYGNAEEKLGPALVGKREGVFLACKTEKRTRDEAAQSIERSLTLLKTDRFDLFQLHGVTTLDEVETVLGPGGALEAVEAAKKQGKLRYVGFSAHSEEAALALMDRYPFDSVLFPINWAAMLKNQFGQKVLQKAEEKDMGRLALKAMARSPWPEGMTREQRPYPKCWYQPIEDERQAELAVRYTLSQPITAAIPPGHMELFRRALAIAEKFTPITPQEIEELKGYDADRRAVFGS